MAEIAWEQVIQKHFIQTKFQKYLFVCVCVWPFNLSVSVCSQCKDCMSAALAATKILKKMAQEGSDADEAEEMLKLADHYEKHAIGMTPQT